MEVLARWWSFANIKMGDDYMISKKKRKRYQKTIAKFCLMDDTFMAKFFENNIEDTG